MNIDELIKAIEFSITDCENIIKNNPDAVLSEGDLEKHLSACISRRIGYVAENPNRDSYAVYTQISHYDNETEDKDAEVDILLMIPNKIERKIDIHKRFVYKSKDSVAIELKYRHDDNAACVTSVKGDIDKFSTYKSDSCYFVVALLDRNDKTAEHEGAIMEYYNKKKGEMGQQYEDHFFCKVLIKEV